MKEKANSTNKNLKSNLTLNNEKGITIIETSISIAIFGFLIVFCLGVFIFVGKIYYKGLYQAETQEVTRSIVDSIAEALLNSGSEVIAADSPSEWGWMSYCIGNVQYSYRKNIQLITKEPLDPDPDWNKERIFDSQASQVFIATNKCNFDSANDLVPIPLDKQVVDPSIIALYNTMEEEANKKLPTERIEFLHERMRVLEFNIEAIGTGKNFYEIDLKLALGGDLDDREFEDTVFEYVDADGTPIPDPADSTWNNAFTFDNNNPENYFHDNVAHPGDPTKKIQVKRCQPKETFCALIQLKTKAYRKIN